MFGRCARGQAAGADGADIVDLDDGSTAEGHAVLLAVGRTFPVASLGLDTIGIDPGDGAALARDGRLRIADGVYLVGDAAGPELHTHQAHYQGVMAVRMALGDAVAPDYRALPRATYTDPELAFVGMSLEQARADGRDGFELVADFPTTAKGYSVEATFGHVTVVVDRDSRQLLGAAIGHARRLRGHPRVRPGDQGARARRRARRHDPRLPVHVPDPERALQRRGEDARGQSRGRGRRIVVTGDASS